MFLLKLLDFGNIVADGRAPARPQLRLYPTIRISDYVQNCKHHTVSIRIRTLNSNAST